MILLDKDNMFDQFIEGEYRTVHPITSLYFPVECSNLIDFLKQKYSPTKTYLDKDKNRVSYIEICFDMQEIETLIHMCELKATEIPNIFSIKAKKSLDDAIAESTVTGKQVKITNIKKQRIISISDDSRT